MLQRLPRRGRMDRRARTCRLLPVAKRASRARPTHDKRKRGCIAASALSRYVVQMRENGNSETLCSSTVFAAPLALADRAKLGLLPGVVEAESTRSHGARDMINGRPSAGADRRRIRPGRLSRVAARSRRSTTCANGIARRAKALGVAGFGAMQAMMYASALWFGAFDGATMHARLVPLAGLLVATPVVLYAARPFFAGALRLAARAGSRWTCRSHSPSH